MTATRSFWWALASLPLMILGALSPWARTLGGKADGSQDEVVLLLAIVAAFMLVFLAASNYRWLAVFPLLIGLTAAGLTGNDIHDIADFAPRVSGHFVSVEWGIYLALFGSTSLVLASVLLFVETAPPRAAASHQRRSLASQHVSIEAAQDVRQRPKERQRKPTELRRRTLHYRERADEVRLRGDLRPTDRVLDVGCASGLIALELARSVGHIHGLDIDAAGVAEASALAAERGIHNATFEVASLVDYPFERLSWDVSLFMLVWGKPAGDKTVGGEELARILGATRRQLVMRAGIQRYRRLEPRLEEILDVCRQNDFDAVCFSRPEEDQVATHGNLIVANRRGADARLGELATLALLPSSLLAK